MRLRFGEFVLDPGTRQLRRGEEERHLGPKAFELLELLLRHRPNVVAKEAIHDRLWPGTFVSGSTLATVVGEIRTALDDDPASPRCLRTVHGVGYAFCGEAREEGPPPAPVTSRALSCRLLFQDREIALRPGENLLGRIDEGVVWIESPSVSRRHARIRVEGGQAILEDLGSKNGTFVGGERIAGAQELKGGERIAIGPAVLVFRVAGLPGSTRTEVRP